MTGQTRRQVALMLVGLLALAGSTAYTSHQGLVHRSREIIDAGEIKVRQREAADGIGALLTSSGRAQGPPGSPSRSP